MSAPFPLPPLREQPRSLRRLEPGPAWTAAAVGWRPPPPRHVPTQPRPTAGQAPTTWLNDGAHQARVPGQVTVASAAHCAPAASRHAADRHDFHAGRVLRRSAPVASDVRRRVEHDPDRLREHLRRSGVELPEHRHAPRCPGAAPTCPHRAMRRDANPADHAIRPREAARVPSVHRRLSTDAHRPDAHRPDAHRPGPAGRTAPTRSAHHLRSPRARPHATRQKRGRDQRWNHRLLAHARATLRHRQDGPQNLASPTVPLPAHPLRRSRADRRLEPRHGHPLPRAARPMDARCRAHHDHRHAALVPRDPVRALRVRRRSATHSRPPREAHLDSPSGLGHPSSHPAASASPVSAHLAPRHPYRRSPRGRNHRPYGALVPPTGRRRDPNHPAETPRDAGRRRLSPVAGRRPVALRAWRHAAASGSMVARLGTGRRQA